MVWMCGRIVQVVGHWAILHRVDTGINTAKCCPRRSMSLMVRVPLSRGNAMTKSTSFFVAGATGLTGFLGVLHRCTMRPAAAVSCVFVAMHADVLAVLDAIREPV